MLNFHPSPLAPAPQNNNFAVTKANLVAAYTPFPPLVAVAVLPMGIARPNIAAKIGRDSNLTLTPSACVGICRSVLTADPGGFLFGHPNLATCTEHYRRLLSEPIAAATNLAVASSFGYRLSCTVREFQALWNPLPTFTKYWNGYFGPDYICADTADGNYIILESKGTSQPIQHKPRKFFEYKLQSMNLKPQPGGVILVGPDAWVLGYTYLSAGEGLSVRWFNHRPSANPGGDENFELMLTVALLQFTNQLRNAGFIEVATAFIGRFKRSLRDIRNAVVDADIAGNVELVLPAEDVLLNAGLEIHPLAFNVFAEVAAGAWQVDIDAKRGLAIRLANLSTAEMADLGWTAVGTRFSQELRLD